MEFCESFVYHRKSGGGKCWVLLSLTSEKQVFCRLPYPALYQICLPSWPILLVVSILCLYVVVLHNCWLYAFWRSLQKVLLAGGLCLFCLVYFFRLLLSIHLSLQFRYCLACYLIGGGISYIVPFPLCLIVVQQFIFLSSQVSLAVIVVHMWLVPMFPCFAAEVSYHLVQLNSDFICWEQLGLCSAPYTWTSCTQTSDLTCVLYESVCFALSIIETAIIILTDHSGTLAASLFLHIHMHIHTGVINSQSDSGNWRNIWPQQLYPNPFWHAWLVGRLSGLS